MTLAWDTKLIRKDLQRRGFDVSEPDPHGIGRKYYDYLAYQGNLCYYVDASKRMLTAHEIQKFKELAEHGRGKAVVAHCKKLFGIIGLKIAYVVL